MCGLSAAAVVRVREGRRRACLGSLCGSADQVGAGTARLVEGVAGAAARIAETVAGDWRRAGTMGGGKSAAREGGGRATLVAAKETAASEVGTVRSVMSIMRRQAVASLYLNKASTTSDPW